MNVLLTQVRDVVLLREPAFETWRDHKDAMKRGVAILLVCFLIAGTITFFISLAANVRPFGPEQADQVRQEFMRGFEQFQMFGGIDEATQTFLDEFTENLEKGLQMGVEISSLPTPLPRGIAGFLSALGSWVSTALGHLTAFLAYGVWVLLFAKLMGGSGGVDRFFGLTALYAVPNLLGIFSPIPLIGPLIALIGWIWGVIVYIKAVQVSQRFTLGKALAAALLPAIIALAVIAVVSMLSLIAFISAVSQ